MTEFINWWKKENQKYDPDNIAWAQERRQSLRAWQACQALNDKRIAELEEKLKVAEADAERYRWLRGSYTHPNCELRVTHKSNIIPMRKVLLDISLDRAIDVLIEHYKPEALKTIEG